MTDHNELAQRIERAEGPDRALDAEIAALCRFFPQGVGFVWRDELRANSPEIGRVECCTNLGTGGPHYAALAYTGSLDAAMQLVPAGHNWAIDTGHKDGISAWCFDRHLWHTDPSVAATPALALCAAAIRARSAS